MDELNLLAVAAATADIISKKRRKKRIWTKSWLLNRKNYGVVNLLKELVKLPDDWKNYLRMDELTFMELLEIVTPLIKKNDTVMREAISPYERLTVTLRFLATGRSYEDIKFSSRISAQALGNIIPETCRALILALRCEYFKFPDSEQAWEEIAQAFHIRWGFPNCLGAVDGKHVSIVQPAGTGSYFYNYKGFFSVILMAIVNADYEFIYCDVGTNGRVSDGGVIKATNFFEDLINGRLKIPPPKPPTGSNMSLPFVFIGDEAFQLRPDFLKPYNQRDLNSSRRIFNAKLSSARQCVEDAFGILSSRFRIFHTDINLKIENVEQTVMACCSLHNFLRRQSKTYIGDVKSAENINTNPHTQKELRKLGELEKSKMRHASAEAKEVREKFLKYLTETKTS